MLRNTTQRLKIASCSDLFSKVAVSTFFTCFVKGYSRCRQNAVLIFCKTGKHPSGPSHGSSELGLRLVYAWFRVHWSSSVGVPSFRPWFRRVRSVRSVRLGMRRGTSLRYFRCFHCWLLHALDPKNSVDSAPALTALTAANVKEITSCKKHNKHSLCFAFRSVMLRL